MAGAKRALKLLLIALLLMSVLIAALTIIPKYTKPSIVIESPYHQQVISGWSHIEIRGTTDWVGVSKVEVKVGSGSWQVAEGTTS